MPEVHVNSDTLKRHLAALRSSVPRDGRMDSLQQLLMATPQLFSASGAGLMMLDESSMLCALAATDEKGRLLEETQEKCGHGPCVDTVTLNRITHTADLAADDRWPELVPVLPRAGIHAVMGVPIRANGVPVGALNLYRDRPYAWDDSDLDALTAYGTLIEGLLQAALEAHEHERLAEQLQHALDNRVMIERAVGAIMARERIDAVSAFNRLRRRARSSQEKVADVAAEVLEEVTGVDLT